MSKVDEINKKILENTDTTLLLHPDIKAILKAVEGLEKLKNSLSEAQKVSTDLETSINISTSLIDIDNSINELEQQIFIEDKK